MLTRTAGAVWEGSLKDGKGTMNVGSGAFDGPYTFASRFEDGKSSALRNGRRQAPHPGRHEKGLGESANDHLSPPGPLRPRPEQCC